MALATDLLITRPRSVVNGNVFFFFFVGGGDVAVGRKQEPGWRGGNSEGGIISCLSERLLFGLAARIIHLEFCHRWHLKPSAAGPPSTRSR